MTYMPIHGIGMAMVTRAGCSINQAAAADTGNEVIITSTPEADPDKMTPITIRSGL